ncbi:MAG: hypothetical protein L0G22_02885 [Propionibacteriaceae bacterium]|nr:hypothetical protein [Propionibacteriaceae bacterium]
MSDDTFVVQPGRPVRLVPTPPGFWMTVLGVVAAGLAPLFGFLIGTILGPSSGDFFLAPLYWSLFTGVLVGAGGVLVAAWGGRRWWRHRMQQAEPIGDDDGAVAP